MKIKTVVLDFDGTIADTRECIMETVRQTLQRLGVAVPDDSAIQEVIGLPLRDTFAKAAKIDDEALIGEAVTVYRELFEDICRRTVCLFPNVRTTLQRLYEDGCTLAIASSRGKESLVSLLELLDIEQFMSCVYGEEDVVNKKPAPDMVTRILGDTQTELHEALVVGDTRYDILMGQGAGCSTCGVTYGNHSAEVLLQQGADYIINDFAQLLEIVH